MKTRSLVFGLLAGLTVLSATSSFAGETQWEKHHPRRDQVNDRLASQNRRINHELKDGQINRAEAKKLHREDRNIRQQERDMAKLDHGHITKQEQNTLNQEENQVSRQISNGN